MQPTPTQPPTPAPRLSKAHRTTERIVSIYLAVSALVSVALIVIVVILVVKYGEVATGQQRSNIQQCQIANNTRVQDIAIWNRLLRVAPSASASTKAEVADLEKLVRVKDTPRNCAAAFKG